MIRRAHQIAVSLFLEETGEFGITNRQYGILLVLKAQPDSRSGGNRVSFVSHGLGLGYDRRPAISSR